MATADTSNSAPGAAAQPQAPVAQQTPPAQHIQGQQVKPVFTDLASI